MQKLGLVILILVAILGFGACGDSKDSQVESSVDLDESQTINANDSRGESSVDLGESQILDSQDWRKSTQESSATSKDCQAKYGNSIVDLYRCLGEAGLDTTHIKSESYPVDCLYQKDISALFHHKDNCTILDQEPRPKCENAVFPKEVEEWANCGTPSVRKIKANSIKEAYDIVFMYKNKEIWFENLPLQNVRKDLPHNDCCFVEYLWEGDKHLEVIYGFDGKDRCDYKIFDLQNGYVKVLEVNDIGCD